MFGGKSSWPTRESHMAHFQYGARCTFFVWKQYPLNYVVSYAGANLTIICYSPMKLTNTSCKIPYF